MRLAAVETSAADHTGLVLAAVLLLASAVGVWAREAMRGLAALHGMGSSGSTWG
jgi:hypothetical protein